MAKIKIYTSPKCPHCKMLKEFLSKKKIDYIAYDVATDKEALKEMINISDGVRSVPVISLCDKVIVGFNQGSLEEELTKCLGTGA
ncbi:MAG: glutaredoxin family protein [Deltaproteobacteria bacterium]|nr:glutaredoxin family protein [Deltaproteobacteria bacterium]MBW2010428.1 glutaredoxin family protein [Deltaproteobacteria bacterium]MBW2099829.1 glutaredoxin family protein [Deltaproteobacteria bacterium]